MTARLSTHRFTRIVATLAVAAALTTGAATQTKIVAPSNKYSPADDVKLGREAGAQAKKELPMLNDERVDDWVEDVGARLVQAIPAELQHPEFHYTFDVVNQSDINAFALPGGPMFLNRGMIEKAKTEGEVAGVMAHELSHVALRHGTAQMTKGEKFQIGASGPQFMSDHPNPANRYQAIVNEAKALRVNGNFNTGQFQNVQARLKQDGRSYTAEEIAQG